VIGSVHLGQERLPLKATIKLMGGKIISMSTYDVEQAKEAETSGADSAAIISDPLRADHIADKVKRILALH
jgi:thiamine monophosphate synthase